MPKIVLLLLVCIYSSVVIAQSKQVELLIQDSRFEQPLTFNVVLPSGYQEQVQKEYVVLFDFHPYAHTFLRGNHDWMSHNGEWPWLKTIIVTPAYGNPVGQLFDATGETKPLLDFFEQKLLPAIDAKYRTNGFRMISGFRHNGAIVLKTLLNSPELFNAYIAISPELKNNFAGVSKHAQTKLKSLSGKPRFLYFSHGSNVKEEHQVDDYKDFKESLEASAPDQLDWHYQHFNDRYFMSLPVVSVVSAIELMFDDIHNGLSPESHIAKAGLDSIDKHYRYLSEKKYGFDVSGKRSMNNLAESYVEAAPAKAIELYNAIAEKFPDDAYSFHNIAKVYQQIGRYKQAINYQTKAVELSEGLATWHQKRHQRFLKEYTESFDSTQAD